MKDSTYRILLLNASNSLALGEKMIQSSERKGLEEKVSYERNLQPGRFSFDFKEGSKRRGGVQQ